MTEGWVEYLTGPWGFAFAFAAGVLSFLSPCVLPLVPAYLAHMTGTTATLQGRTARARTLAHAGTFVLGFGLVFTLFGASVGLLSTLAGDDQSYALRDQQDLLAKIGAVFLIVMGLNLIGVIRLPWLYRSYSFELPAARPLVAAGAGAGGGGGSIALGGGGGGPWSGLAYAKSLGVGATFAMGWTPCIGPVLGSIFGLALVGSSVATGASLLAVYSLGLGLPFIITGMAVVPVTAFLRRVRGVMPVVEVATGVMVVFVGALIFLGEMTVFNRYFDFFGLSSI